jgi:hypothetical protein
MHGAKLNVAYNLLDQTSFESRDIKLTGHHLVKWDVIHIKSY